MLGLILGGVALGASFILSNASKDINDDMRRDINDINDNIEDLYINTRLEMQNTRFLLEDAYKSLNKTKSRIVETTLTRFTDTMSNLKNVDFKDSTVKNRLNMNIEYNVKEASYNRNYDFEKRNSTLTTAITTALFGAVGNTISATKNYKKYKELEEEYEKSKTELRKMKIACTKAKGQMEQVQGIIYLCGNTERMLDDLSKMDELLIDSVSIIIKESGNNYVKYTEEEKDAVMMMVNTSMLINDLVFNDFFDDDGKFKEEYYKYIGAAIAVC